VLTARAVAILASVATKVVFMLAGVICAVTNSSSVSNFLAVDLKCNYYYC